MGNRKLEFEASVYFLCAFCLNLDLRIFYKDFFDCDSKDVTCFTLLPETVARRKFKLRNA